MATNVECCAGWGELASDCLSLDLPVAGLHRLAEHYRGIPTQVGVPSSHLLWVSRTTLPSERRTAWISPYGCGLKMIRSGSSSFSPPRCDVNTSHLPSGE